MYIFYILNFFNILWIDKNEFSGGFCINIDIKLFLCYNMVVDKIKAMEIL